MPTYKDEKTGLWYCKFVYKDWTGKSIQKKKMGFKLQREAKEYEMDFLNRFSGSSLLIELGFSPLLVSERLGHEDIQTTLETYSHLYPHKNEEVSDKLNKLCG